MADTAYIFDNAAKCGSEVFRKYLGYLFTNGVFGDGLKVSSRGGMQIGVASGYGHINGAVMYFEGEQVMTLTVASVKADRIDTVVLEYSEAERDVLLRLLKGDPADPPVPVELTRSGGVYQVALAQITVRKGSVEVTAEDIEDMREPIRGRVRELDFSQVTAAFEDRTRNTIDERLADFDRWYEDVYSKDLPLPDGTEDKARDVMRDNEEFVSSAGDRLSGLKLDSGLTRDEADALTDPESQFGTISFSAIDNIYIPAADYDSVSLIVLKAETNGKAASISAHGGTSAIAASVPFTVYLLKDKASGSFIGNFSLHGFMAESSYAYYDDYIYGYLRLEFENTGDTWRMSALKMWAQYTTQYMCSGGTDSSYSSRTPSDLMSQSWISGPAGEHSWVNAAPLKCGSIAEFNAGGIDVTATINTGKTESAIIDPPFDILSAQIIRIT